MKRFLLFIIMFFIFMNGVHSVDLSYTEISVVSRVIEDYTSSTGKIPNAVVLNNKNVSMDDYLYAATTTTINLNSNRKVNVTIKGYKPPTNVTTTTATGPLYKTYSSGVGYLQAAQNIKTYMEANGRSPNYVTTKIGKINYPTLIYSYAKIINFYKAYQRLPNSITIIAAKTFISNVTDKGVVLGRTDYGVVIREGPYGDSSSPNKVVYIVGVHPLESQAHNGMVEAIKTLNDSLRKCYYIYRVNVTKDAYDYEKGRVYGELLANQYAVPDIKRISPKLVIDVHSNRGNYAVKRFLFVPYNSTEANRIANMIKNGTNWLTIYTPPSSSSATYVTIPLIKAGIPSIIYETYTYEPYNQTLKQALQITSIIDSLIF